jgi:Helix-hairpin-helix domain
LNLIISPPIGLTGPIRSNRCSGTLIADYFEMINQEIAEIFDHMSRVLAFKGKDRFRALAYERAAGSLRGLDQDVTG